MQQNFEILDVSMSATSSFGTSTTQEKAHAFTNLGPFGPSKKSKKPEWEFNQVFQTIWDAKLPSAQIVISPNGKSLMVKCRICTDVKKHEKLHVLKFDGL
jgi:hypothetical protein